MDTSKIRLDQVSVEYSPPGSGRWPWKRNNGEAKSRTVLDSISLEMGEGEFVSILGHSGCGKSTLLKVVAGFIKPTRGAVWVDGKKIEGPQGDHVFVFQEGALFPWLSIMENTMLSLRRSTSGAERRDKALHYLELVGLEEFANHYPHMLSGGMRQRAEIARALGAQPNILLMDEPFSGLDALTRLHMREEMLYLQMMMPQTTILFVTHDIDEALQLSKRLVIMSEPPSHVKCCRSIDVPHPRTITDSDLKDTRALIYHHLGVHTAL
ncbi:MAG: ABC transporter ATP-binding protein [Acidobacteriota bacterium]